MTVFQAVASFVPRDAVTEAARRFRDLLEPDARQPRIIAEGIHRELRKEAIHFDAFGPGGPDDVIVYHLSTDSALAGWLEGRPERVVVYYHNLTPPEFLAPYDPTAGRRLAEARRQGAALAGVAAAGTAPSSYNLGDLEEWGYRETMVVPYPSAPGLVWPDRKQLLAFSRGKAPGGDILFVGRITPNKCQHDLLRAMAVYQEREAGARLFMVGSTHLPLYEHYCRELSDRLGLGAAPFVGAVSHSVLAAHYVNADIYCSLSRHEGFGVPIVEAMAAGLPVVALGEAAVPETVGDAGILLDSAEPRLVAEVLARVHHDLPLRFEMIEAGLERAYELTDRDKTREALLVACGVTD